MGEGQHFFFNAIPVVENFATVRQFSVGKNMMEIALLLKRRLNKFLLSFNP